MVSLTPLRSRPLCRTFGIEAEKIWTMLGAAYSGGVGRSEETITEDLLLNVKTAHPYEVIEYQFNKREEAFTGADWEWWLTDGRLWYRPPSGCHDGQARLDPLAHAESQVDFVVFVEAGDLLFPSGGYQLSPAGKTELSTNIVPKLTGLQNAKVVVYGYTDSTPVGPQLKQQGINDKSDLIVATGRCGCNLPGLAGRKLQTSSRPKGSARPIPWTSNDTPEGRAKNRRIVITVQGPGAPSTE